jgi:hypothetical protein
MAEEMDTGHSIIITASTELGDIGERVRRGSVVVGGVIVGLRRGYIIYG